MRIALSGTPGTGKTSAGKVLAGRGHEVIELGDFIKDRHLAGRMDRRRGTREVDVPRLDEALKEALGPGTYILIGHLSHLLAVDLIVVLRCRPSLIKRRLEARGYAEGKVRENMEAEGCDVILVEAVETGKEVLEIDTSQMSPEQVADAVEEILAGEREKYAIGDIDWSEEVMGWY